MKFFAKIILTSALFLSTSALASMESNLAALLQSRAGMPIKIVKVYELESFKGVKFVSIEGVANAQRYPIFASNDGKSVIGYSNLFFTDNEKDNATIQNALKEIQNHNESAKDKKLNEIFSQIPENHYITLQSTGKNISKTTIVVTDPECPYCRNELKHIEEKLKETNIKILLAPVHERSAFIKSQIAMDKIARVKSDKERISILREVYAESYKISQKERDMKTPLIDENAEKIYGSGLIRGVPFIFEMH
ncbi:MAG: hypothetical protein ACTTH5_00285 [Wolinella sp.]